MGISGFILSQRTETDIKNTITYVTSALSTAGCCYSFNTDKSFDNTEYGFIGVSEYKGSDKGMVLYVYNKSKPFSKNIDLSHVPGGLYEKVLVEDISNCQEMLLRVLHHYLKNDYNMYFYIPAINKLFDKKLLDQAYYGNSWSNWCFKETTYNSSNFDENDLLCIAHSYVERSGLCELVLNKIEYNKSELLKKKILSFLSLHNYKFWDNASTDERGTIKNQITISIENDEFIEFSLWKDIDPINEGVYDDICKGLGIVIEIKYTLGSTNLIKKMLRECVDDMNDFYVYSESHSSMKLSLFCADN